LPTPTRTFPLGLATAAIDIQAYENVTKQVNIGYNSQAPPSKIIGHAMFGGGDPLEGSYIDIEMGSTNTWAKWSVTMWIKPTSVNDDVTLLVR
jgi:hypothetical protein